MNQGKKKFSVNRRSMKHINSDTKSLPDHGSPELLVDAYQQQIMRQELLERIERQGGGVGMGGHYFDIISEEKED